MPKHLVIVESPAKVKSISKYLGKDFIVKSSIGHIRDLPKFSQSRQNSSSIKNKKDLQLEWPSKEAERLAARMSVDPYHGWTPQYAIDPNKLHVAKELISLAAEVDFIYLATDLDREGEAIAWHIKEIIGGDDSRYRRVTFNAITKAAIQEAFESPRDLNMDRVHAQQTRRFLDRVVGFMLSPLLWKKICKNLSAGRVQSPAVRLIVQRETEIKNFLPVTTFGITSYLGVKKGPFLPCDLKKVNGAIFKCSSIEKAQSIINLIKQSDFLIKTIEKRDLFSKPQPPFTTSTLQQAASTQLGFSVKKTMTLAQRLYEAGLITYMRTDSTHLSAEAVDDARAWIFDSFGTQYLPKEFCQYSSKSNAQEAHEAIRPTNFSRLAETLDAAVEPHTRKLYELIWKRFIAALMTPAQYEVNKIIIDAKCHTDCFELHIKGQRQIFQGWTRIYPDKKDEAFSIPDAWRVGACLFSDKTAAKRFVTRPPARYSEALLVKELDKRGIGRPSTYESIIETIQKRGYVELINRRFHALKLGEITSSLLVQRFEPWISYDFTAKMEDSLDAIANSQQEWKEVLDNFFFPFAEVVKLAAAPAAQGGLPESKSLELKDFPCPLCQRALLLRVNIFGPFLACSGYNNKENICKHVISLKKFSEEYVEANEEADGEIIGKELNDQELSENEELCTKRCSVCCSSLDHYQVNDSDQKFSICGNYPACNFYEITEFKAGQSKNLEPVESIPCPECNTGKMVKKTGRFGLYMLCNDCKATRKILKNGTVVMTKSIVVDLPQLICLKRSDDHYVLRQGSSGLFLAASRFPKVREARAIAVEELKRFTELLPNEWKIYTQAPSLDPEGNLTILRFNRKSKQQYVSSKKNGKWTKFVFEFAKQ